MPMLDFTTAWRSGQESRISRADDVPAGGIDDRTVADQVDQIFALVTKVRKSSMRFSQHELAAGLAQSVFRDLKSHGAGKTNFAFALP